MVSGPAHPAIAAFFHSLFRVEAVLEHSMVAQPPEHNFWTGRMGKPAGVILS